MISELMKLGLSLVEAKVYLAGLEMNGGPVSMIAKKAGIERVSCYHTLENLLKKRLFTVYTKNRVRYFVPEPPAQILELFEEKVNLTKALIPELLSRTNVLAFKPKIRFYEGREGVEHVFLESLGAQGEILGLTNLKNILPFFPDFFRHYTHEKLRKGIKTRYLSPDTMSMEALKPFLPKQYDSNLIEMLLVNKNEFPVENEMLIFNHCVSIVSLHESELLGLIVASPTFAHTMKALFDLAWLGATRFVTK